MNAEAETTQKTAGATDKQPLLRAYGCPFCKQPHEGLLFCQVRPETWAVICPRCNTVGPHPSLGPQTYQDAIARWNVEER